MKTKYLFCGIVSIVIIVSIIAFYNTPMMLKIRFFLIPESSQAGFIYKNTRALNLYCGAEKSQAIIPYPHNVDNENVWIWLSNIEEYKKSGRPLKWKEMSIYGNGIFVIFIENKIITQCPWKIVSNTPDEILSSYYYRHKDSRDEINSILRKSNLPEFKPPEKMFPSLFPEKLKKANP